MSASICLFHNGNSRILAHYREKFSNLQFCGNLSEAKEFPSEGCFWEICYADADPELFIKLKKLHIKILRHISTYEDDCEHILSECEKFDYDTWLNNAVLNNLCMSDEVLTDFTIKVNSKQATALITTGRTANTHLQIVLRDNNQYAFESGKVLDKPFLDASDAILVWRENQWQCLTSTWITKDFGFKHQLENTPDLKFDGLSSPIDKVWIRSDWVNLCLIVLSCSLFSKYICQRPTYYTTTEYITKTLVSKQKPIPYDKTKIIPEYQKSKEWYEHSGIVDFLNIVYNNVTNHLDIWSFK